MAVLSAATDSFADVRGVEPLWFWTEYVIGIEKCISLRAFEITALIRSLFSQKQNKTKNPLLPFNCYDTQIHPCFLLAKNKSMWESILTDWIAVLFCALVETKTLSLCGDLGVPYTISISFFAICCIIMKKVIIIGFHFWHQSRQTFNWNTNIHLKNKTKQNKKKTRGFNTFSLLKSQQLQLLSLWKRYQTALN